MLIPVDEKRRVRTRVTLRAFGGGGANDLREEAEEDDNVAFNMESAMLPVALTDEEDPGPEMKSFLLLCGLPSCRGSIDDEIPDADDARGDDKPFIFVIEVLRRRLPPALLEAKGDFIVPW